MRNNRSNFYRLISLLSFIMLFPITGPGLFAQLTMNISRVLMAHGALSSPEKLGLAADVVQRLTQNRVVPEAYWILCEIELQTANAATARDSCSLANPTVYEMVRVGDSLARRQHSEEALLAYELARDLYPNAALVYHRLGKAYAPGKEPAVMAFREAIRLAEGGDRTLSQSELAEVHLELARNYLWWEAYELALEETQASIAVSPTHNARAHRLQARAYAHLGQFELAQRSMEEAVRQDGSFWPYLDWGDVLHIAGQPTLAAEKYWQAVELADVPGQALGYARLCQLYLDLGNAEDALATCRMLVTQFGEQSQHMLMLGDAYQLAGDLDSAKVMYHRVLAADPRNEQALHRLRDLDEGGAR